MLEEIKLKNSQPRILYPEKLYFKNIEVINAFPDKQKLREFVITSLALKKRSRESSCKEKGKDTRILEKQKCQ